MTTETFGSTAYNLLRPVGPEFPDGKGFLVEGPKWGYHFNALGDWVPVKPGENGQHGGVDIICPIGTPVHAPSAGRIIKAGWQDQEYPHKGWGLHVKLECSEPRLNAKGLKILPWLTLAHLSELRVREGDYVNLGQIVGLSGETGHAFGPHLHAQLEEPGDWPRRPIEIRWHVA